MYYEKGKAFTFSNWECLITDINAILQTPPEKTTCRALAPLDLPTRPHIWSIQDIEEVRTALSQTCPDIKFEVPLTLWSTKIIDEIVEQLDKVWCNCKKERDCVADCPNAVAPGLPFQGLNPQYYNEEDPNILATAAFFGWLTYIKDFGVQQTFLGSFSLGNCIDADLSYLSPIRAALAAAGQAASAAKQGWETNWALYCATLKDQADQISELQKTAKLVETEQRRVDSAAEALEDANDSNREELAQRLIELTEGLELAKGNKIAAQAALNDLIAMGNSYKVLADSFEAEADAKASETIELSRQNVAPGSVYAFADGIDSQPMPRTACEQLGPDCLGQSPTRCEVFWAICIRDLSDFRFGNVGEVPNTTWTKWRDVARGSYTKNGVPIIRGSGGLSGHFAYTFDQIMYDAFRSCTVEVMLLQRFPTTSDTGETCCEEGNENG
jgi:hypothetical protein